jgi:hypothetical protein
MKSTSPTAQTALLRKQLRKYHEGLANMVNFSAAPAENTGGAGPRKQQIATSI